MRSAAPRGWRPFVAFALATLVISCARQSVQETPVAPPAGWLLLPIEDVVLPVPKSAELITTFGPDFSIHRFETRTNGVFVRGGAYVGHFPDTTRRPGFGPFTRLDRSHWIRRATREDTLLTEVLAVDDTKDGRSIVHMMLESVPAENSGLIEQLALAVGWRPAARR